ncbi:MAG: 2-oxo acid dehydrogenase subunit E2 [Sandaracinaceae bacterium]|nr:2-oxo acid dehydrogenase subunit E2 [Sandaracinaceae bacterium]MDW8245105.1 dihydrolipoamide acetyltransferase family protein [Sandaracinaceae bacterium]
MARFEFKLPDIGEGVAEGEVVAWHVQPGDEVHEDQPMVDIMTDKATVTIGAPKKGRVIETRGKPGDILPVGTLLVVLEVEEGERSFPRSSASPSSQVLASPPEASPPPSEKPRELAASAVGEIREELPGTAHFSAFSASQPSSPAIYWNERPLATPAVRRLARELGVDLRRVVPSGEGGRITTTDIQRHVQAKNAGVTSLPPQFNQVTSETTSTSPSSSQSSPSQHQVLPSARFSLTRQPIAIQPPPGTPPHLEERRPFVGIRRKIAERMQLAKTTAAHFTFVEECDVGALKAWRERLKPKAEARGVKLTYLPFIVKAAVSALKAHPILNSALDESTNELVIRHYYHIGIATATEQGLMVPVIRDADRKSLLEIASEIERLAKEARAGTISPSDLVGSTFTITSLGEKGGLLATPVLNFPEVAILGVHQIKRRPVVRGDSIVIGEIMLLSLSFDHRIVDGHVGAAFAYDIIRRLEDPDSLVLEL